MMLFVLLLLSPVLGGEYTLGAGMQDFVIDYDKTLDDFEDIKSPSCGKEIDQMDVQVVNTPNQIRISFTGEMV